jgi:hypothetical protein
MEQIITDGIRSAAALVDGIRSVETRLVWEPAWQEDGGPSPCWLVVSPRMSL